MVLSIGSPSMVDCFHGGFVILSCELILFEPYLQNPVAGPGPQRTCVCSSQGAVGIYLQDFCFHVTKLSWGFLNQVGSLHLKPQPKWCRGCWLHTLKGECFFVCFLRQSPGWKTYASFRDCAGGKVFFSSSPFDRGGAPWGFCLCAVVSTHLDPESYFFPQPEQPRRCQAHVWV